MTQQAEGGHNPNDQRPYLYFVDDVKYEWPQPTINGAEIRSRIPGLDAAFQIFLEEHGGKPDLQIVASTIVNLKRETEAAPQMYTAPPATFG